MNPKAYRIDEYLSQVREETSQEDVGNARKLAEILERSLLVYLRTSPFTPVVQYRVDGMDIYVQRVSLDRPLTYVITFPGDIESKHRTIRALTSFWGTPAAWSTSGRHLTLNFMRHLSEEGVTRWLEHAIVKIKAAASQRPGSE